MRVVHATEAMGGGIVTFTASISRRQVESGLEVEVWFLERPDTPTEEVMRALFDSRVKLVRLGNSGESLRFARALRDAYRGERADVFHLHSATGGALGRLALFGVRTRSKIFYSPHGFPFLRSSSSQPVRYLYRVIETLLSRFGSGLILTSKSELDLAVKYLRAKNTFLLQSGVPSESVRRDPRVPVPGARVVVGTAGRIIYQKAPWRFAAVAKALSTAYPADFVWIGDGEASKRDGWMGDSPVLVTGWVEPAELATLLETIDVFLFPSLWEGMALSLMQAQARGIPAVVSDAVGNIDSVQDGISGIVCRSDAELIEATKRLIEDVNLRFAMSASALNWASNHLIDDAIGIDSIRIYGASE